MPDDSSPEIIECDLRLHSAQPANKAPGELVCEDWLATAVGNPVRFEAIAVVGRGAWGGPLPPGAEISPPVPLDDPWWSVFLPSSKGVPVVMGPVGRPLAIGDAFNLAPAEEGVWTTGVVFDGAIVIE
jgi:hypothetical protein